ncbi:MULTISPECIES: hypothetical protein [Lactobacillaceae]|uniref:DUF2304 domain-containing protein n=1 Tax=Acetilactobacillus jinshanensis TaxID=1720083 RepID=A0A4P6ZIU2_9LACO|nr:hypothetical protein [Acetilactobacillus jinshanensis]QBP17621.1 hypothetical protein ELX58_00115 [Acetilactobacillus jinshanensis]URL61835.1 hypothetical protein HGK75_07840 [uncultured bacterium]
MPISFRTFLLIFGISCLIWAGISARIKQKMSYREIIIRYGLIILLLFMTPMIDNLLDQKISIIIDYLVVMAVFIGDDIYHIHQVKVLKNKINSDERIERINH